MLKKFYAKCIKSDSQGRLIVGQVYECEAWQGKTLINGACIVFMGSGTTAVACIKESRHFIGFELNEEYYKAACERVKAEQAQLKLF